MKDNPCVICGELERKIRKVDVWVDDVGLVTVNYGMSDLENHKRICNVWRQYRWLMN